MKELIVVSGNIGAGKSTLLTEIVNQYQEHTEKKVILVEEGIESDPIFKQKLETFYYNPETRLDFQKYITDFRHKRLNEYPENTILISERGLMDDIVFSNANSLDLENVDGQFITYYYDLLKRLKYDYPKIKANIYLRTEPENCFNNIKKRNRESEENITLEYLEILHHCHEAFLPYSANKFNYPLITRYYNNNIDKNILIKSIIKELNTKKEV